MKNILKLLAVVCLMVFLLVISCTPHNVESRQNLDLNEEKWSEQAALFNRNYVYTLRIGCF
jgi:hypothetical protein